MTTFLEVQHHHKVPSSVLRSTSRVSSSQETDAATRKIESILASGVVEHIKRRQMDLREYLVDVEFRLNKTIDDFLKQYSPEPLPPIPETAAVVGGSVDQELNKVVMAVNAVTDKKLRFTLTTFLDDYKRILLSNREPEKVQIVAELEEHFKDGSDLMVNIEDETEEMEESFQVAERIRKCQRDLQSEVISLIKQLQADKVKAEMKAATVVKDPEKSWTEAVYEMREILAKPSVQECLGKDLEVLKRNLDAVVFRLSSAKPFDLRSNSTMSNYQRGLGSTKRLSKFKPKKGQK